MKKNKLKPKETILDQEKFMYQDDLESQAAADDFGMIDYNKRPAPTEGRLSLFTSLIGFAFLVLSVILMYASEGKPGFVITAMAACSVLWALAGCGFAVKSLFEKDRNYTISFIAMGIGAFQLVCLFVTVILGGRA